MSLATIGATGALNSRGMTPIATYGQPLKVRVRPIADGSPANRRCQNPNPSTAVSMSASPAKVRPYAGRTPTTSKKLALTTFAPTRTVPSSARHLHRGDAGERVDAGEILVVRVGDFAGDREQAIVGRGAAEAGPEQHPGQRRVDAEVQADANRDRHRRRDQEQRAPGERPRRET